MSKSSFVCVSPSAAPMKGKPGLSRGWSKKIQGDLPSRLGWQTLLSLQLYSAFLTRDLCTNKAKEYNTLSFQKLAMRTTLYTLRCPEFLHWFEWGQEELEKLMGHQRHWGVSTKLSYRNKPPSCATLQAHNKHRSVFSHTQEISSKVGRFQWNHELTNSG